MRLWTVGWLPGAVIHVFFDCDPRCFNRMAVMLVGDRWPSEFFAPHINRSDLVVEHCWLTS
eukprot:7826412-Pyramimonas_sp.AAC.1